VSAYRSHTHLEQLFDQLNTDLFDGRIAPCAVQRSPILVRVHRCDGLYEPLHHRIVLQSGLSPRIERRVLIHEMCHARLPEYRGHGRPFLDQLRRLGRLGERWAVDEAQRYVTDPWLRVVDALDDLDHEWHALPASASRAWRCAILAKADRLLAKL
jgi:hypothetical protein